MFNNRPNMTAAQQGIGSMMRPRMGTMQAMPAPAQAFPYTPPSTISTPIQQPAPAAYPPPTISNPIQRFQEGGFVADDLESVRRRIMENHGFDPVDIAMEQGIDPELFLRLIRQESGGRQSAVSEAGAMGLTQLMPGTAEYLGVDPSDALQNARGGAAYLREQLDRFGTVPLALAAYNAGPGRVSQYGGIPPFEETRNYVAAITGAPREEMLPSESEFFMFGPDAESPSFRPRARPTGDEPAPMASEYLLQLATLPGQMEEARRQESMQALEEAARIQAQLQAQAQAPQQTPQPPMRPRGRPEDEGIGIYSGDIRIPGR